MKGQQTESGEKTFVKEEVRVEVKCHLYVLTKDGDAARFVVC